MVGLRITDRKIGGSSLSREIPTRKGGKRANLTLSPTFQIWLGMCPQLVANHSDINVNIYIA